MKPCTCYSTEVKMPVVYQYLLRRAESFRFVDLEVSLLKLLD